MLTPSLFVIGVECPGWDWTWEGGCEGNTPIVGRATKGANGRGPCEEFLRWTRLSLWKFTIGIHEIVGPTLDDETPWIFWGTPTYI